MKDALIIFAKNPVYGLVKTRLAATAGKDKALNVYKKLLEYTATITMRLDISKFVFYADAIEVNDIWNDRSNDVRNDMRNDVRNDERNDVSNDMRNEDRNDIRNDVWNEKTAGISITKKLQQGNDLGEKMNEAFKSVFEAGYDKAVIIGTDCPELDAATIVQAFKQLDLHDVVI